MRTLSDALLRAQKSASSRPWVRVEALDRMAGIARLRFRRLHTGSEPEGPHALTVPADGSLVRARVDPLNNHTLYFQRVAGPSPASDFSRWASLGAVSGEAQVALCSRGSEVLLFSVSTNRRTVHVRASSDSGATFGQPAYVTTASSAVTSLAAAFKPDGTVLLLYVIGNGLYTTRRSGGSWGPTRIWTNSLSRIDGVAVHFNEDWNVVVTGRDAGNGKSGVWSTVLGEGSAQTLGAWSVLKAIAESRPGQAVDYRSPYLDRPDVDRLFLMERTTGPSGRNRAFFTFTTPSASFLDNLWREPAAFEFESAYGPALGHTGDDAWLSTANGVWSAPLNPPPLDLSGDVISVTGKESTRSARWQIELRNDDGRYSKPGEDGLALLVKGSEVRVGLGYVTGQGRQSSPCPPAWIESLEHRRAGGSSTLVVQATGGWRLLAWQQARRERRWGAGEAGVFEILRSVLARAGYECRSASANFLLDHHKPKFLIEESEPLDMVVERLMAYVPDVLLAGSGGGFVLVTPSADDALAYAYGSGHGVREGRYADPVPRYSRALVFGSGHTSDESEWSDFPVLFGRPIHIHDASLDTREKADARAAAETRRMAIHTARGSMTVPVNAGQELYDVIEVTDTTAGINSARYRTLGLETRYAVGPRGSRYEQIIHLGGV